MKPPPDRSTRWIGIVFGLAILATSLALVGPIRGVKLVVGALVLLVAGAREPSLAFAAVATLAASFLGLVLPVVAMLLPRRTQAGARIGVLLAAVACLGAQVWSARALGIGDASPPSGDAPPPRCDRPTRPTADVGAVCDRKPGGFARGSEEDRGGCPAGYACTVTMGAQGQSCQLECGGDCACPAEFRCLAGLCARGPS